MTSNTSLDDSEFIESEPREAAAIKPARKARQPKPEPTYIVPDVCRRETTFKGRLGLLDSIGKNGIRWVKELGWKNTDDLLKMIQWNEDNNIRFMRISSEMFPFALHAVHGYSLEYCAPLLAQVGALAKKLGHRLNAHPGQYTQLGGPKPEVVQSSIRELVYHSEMMDRMGLGIDSVLIVHGGGKYEDKSATLAQSRRPLWSVWKYLGEFDCTGLTKHGAHARLGSAALPIKHGTRAPSVALFLSIHSTSAILCIKHCT
ncbi:UV-endonuclease UvdE-domain-containing protein [Mycena sp. CBHHK59/15]|nr:UV-endonuclease UvdE-domain-containing protein [Mycena sp. CBHHK59/15]